MQKLLATYLAYVVRDDHARAEPLLRAILDRKKKTLDAEHSEVAQRGSNLRATPVFPAPPWLTACCLTHEIGLTPGGRRGIFSLCPRSRAR